MSSKSKIQFVERDEAAGISIDNEGNRTIEIMEFDLNKMHPTDPNDLKYASKSIVIGKPGRGKSVCIEHIMLYKNWICPVMQVFSGSESATPFYTNHMVSDITLFNELDLPAMENFAKRQNIAKQFLPNSWAMSILDDVTDEPSVLRKPVFNAYFKRGRHWSMVFVLAVQYPLDIPTALRSCVDYVFIMANSIIAEREKIYENFASGAIPTYQDFCDLMNQLTTDYTAMVIDNTSTSSIITDRVFFFKADLSRVPINFKVGSKDIVPFAEERKDPNYRESFI